MRRIQLRNQLITISIIILTCLGILSGCVTQNNQNNTTNHLDTQGPTPPTNVRCISAETDTTPTFRWNASTDPSGIAGYYVKIDAGSDIWVGASLTWESTYRIANGSHQFSVKAKDASTNGNNGTYESCSFIINATTQNRPPIADAQGPYSGYRNISIIFDGSKSYDPDGFIMNYTWEFGDGTKAYGMFTTHKFNKTGVYIISLTVKDNESILNTTTTNATIQLFSENGDTQNNNTNESSTEQKRFLGSWHNQANQNEHWIFYSNWTQLYTILIADNPEEEPYTAELRFNYTLSNNILCQSILLGGQSPPTCYPYEFSDQDTILTLYSNDEIMVILIKE